MDRVRRIDLAALCDSVPDGIITSGGLRAAGVPSSTTATRCRPGGPWQRILPGVVLLSSRAPTPRQRLRAAATYAGKCVVTGVEALHRQGVATHRNDSDTPVHVLVEAGRRLASREYVVVERTARVPDPVWRDGIPFAPVVRAAIDAARGQRDPLRLRAVLFAPVNAGACTLADLRAELAAGNQRGTAAPRALLNSTEVDDVLPIVAARARRLVAAAPLPSPSWHLPLRAESGQVLGIADAWWGEVALAWDFGVRGTPEREAMADAGVLVLHTPPARLHDDPGGVIEELVGAFLRAARRPRPPVHAQLSA